MQPDDEARELFRRKAAELEQWSREMRAQIDQLKAQRERQQRRFRFFSRDRVDYWKMPKWLWIPIVAILVGMFVVALYSVGHRPS